MNKDVNKSVLPTERLARSSRRELALSLLVLLASGVVLNLFAHRILNSNSWMNNPSYVAFDAQWRRLDSLEEGLDTLILGDSSGRHGLDPQEYDRVAGGQSLNFCTMGNAAVINPAWQLEAYLQRWPAPQRVLLVIAHNVWLRTLNRQLVGRVPMEWGFWGHMRATQYYSRGERWKIFENRYLPSLSQHRTLSFIALYPWKAGEHQIVLNASGFAPIWKPRPDLVAKDRGVQIEAFGNRAWHASKQSRQALDAMMTMAEEFDFELYIVLSPMNSGLFADQGFRQYYESYIEGISRLISGSRRTHLVSGAPALYEDDEMQNTDHLARKMTPAYTRLVAEQVLQVESHVLR
jgi:hypothetical protein